jgi:hypothetical protein
MRDAAKSGIKAVTMDRGYREKSSYTSRKRVTILSDRMLFGLILSIDDACWPID